MSEFPIPRDGYLAFDAYTLKQHIKNALNKSGKFTDQNYEGSYISSIIDIVAYMFHVLMFYLNKTSTETMFSEAQIYENINRVVKMLDYKPIGMSTSVLSFNMQANSALRTGTHVIPRYSYISARGVPYTFNTDIFFTKNTNQTEPIPSVSDNILLYQGVWREYPLYTAKGEQNEIIYITPGKNVKIDHNNIDVYIKTADSGNWEQWDRSYSLYLENGYDKKYEVRFNENKQYEIKFGNNVNGKKLEETDKVAIYYLESRGENGEVGVGALNGQPLKMFRTMKLQEILIDVNKNSPINYLTDDEANQLYFSNSSISTYSGKEEDVESIRTNAPATFRSQFRLVTQGDFEAFINTNFALLVHDVKIMNNWSYLSEYLKYFHDLGLTNPNDVSRVLYNQLNFADACNFNNVYVFIVPKIITNSQNNINYLSPANKQLIISSTNQLKALTSEIIILDPVFLTFKLCAPRPIRTDTKVEDADDTILEISKNPNSRRDDSGIRKDITTIIDDYFRKENVKLGQLIDVAQMTADILSVPGVDNIATKNTVTGDTFEGVSMIYWNPVYPNVKPTLVFNNQKLSDFMFPVFDDTDITNKLVITTRKIFESVEY